MTLCWGIIGTGGIASDFATALAGSAKCRVVNAVGSSPPKGAAFAERFALPRWSRCVDELLEDAAVSAVYVATPHPLHAEHAGAALRAGKAVLCEKPLTTSADETEALVGLARERGGFLMEAFMYRCHPLTSELISRLRAGAIGPIRHLVADFSFRVPRNPQGRLFNPELGGGGILDVGGYPMSFARLVAGLIEGRPFAEPRRLEASGVIGPTGVDELATALLEFDSGFSAQITCGVHHDVGTRAVIYGEDGKIVLPNPWIPDGSRQALESRFEILRDDRPPETVAIRTHLPTYGLEAELVADSLPAVEPPYPAMNWADSLGNARAIDRFRAAVRAARS